MQGWFEPPSTSKLFFEVVKMLWTIFLLNGSLCSCVAPEFTRGKKAWKARKKICCAVSNSENRKCRKPNLHKEGLCLFVTDSQVSPLLDASLSFWLFLYCQFQWLCLKPDLIPLPPWLSQLCFMPFLGMFAVKSGASILSQNGMLPL